MIPHPTPDPDQQISTPEEAILVEFGGANFAIGISFIIFSMVISTVLPL